MDIQQKALNTVSHGVNIFASIYYYTSIFIIMLFLLYNIYAFFRNLKEYINNRNTNVNIVAHIDKIEKELIGIETIKNSKYSSTSANKYKYKLTLSFTIGEEKIVLEKEEITTDIYYEGGILNLIYNTNLKKIVTDDSAFIILNIIIIIICLGLLYLFYKYPDEIKGMLFVGKLLK